MYSLQEPNIATTTCPNQLTLKGTGIIQLAPGCDLRIKERTLPGTTNRKAETELIYAPLLHLNISALFSALQEFQGYIPTRKSMSAQTKETTPGDKVFKTNEKSLERLEQQLYDFSLTRRAGNSQIRMIHGSYLGLGLISIALLIYILFPRISKLRINCNQRHSTGTRAVQCVNFSTINFKEEQEPTPARNSLLQTTTEKGTSTRAVTPAAQPRERPTTDSVIQLLSQTLQPV